MKLLRWLAISFAAFVVLAGGALFFLHRRYPPERIRELALAELEPALGRKLRIQSVRLGLRGVKLGGVEVSEAPDFSAGTFLKAERIAAGWSLRALLERRLAVSEVSLSGFECRLVKDSKGVLNAASLGRPASKPEAPAPPPAKAPPPEKGKPAPEPAKPPPAGAKEEAGPAVSISRLSAEGGTISYKDAAGLSAKLRDLRALVTDFRPGAEFPVELSFAFEAANKGAKHAGSLSGEALLKPDPKGGTGVAIRSLRLKADGAEAKLKGELLAAADGALNLKFAPLELSKAGSKAELEGTVSRSAAGAVKLSAKGLLPELTSARLKELGADVPDGLALPAGRLSAELSYAGERVDLGLLSLVLGEAKLDVRGSAKLGAVTALDLRLKTADLPLETLQPVAPALALYAVRGRATLDLAVKGDSAAPVVSGEGKVAGLAARAAGLPLDGASLDLKFDPKQAKLALKGKLGGSDLTLELDARDYSASPDLRVEGRLAGLDLGTLTAAKGRAAPAPESAPPGPAPQEGGEGKAKPAEPPAKAKKAAAAKSSGKFSIGPIKHPNFQASSADFSWNLTGLEPGLARLNGKANLKVGGGKLDDLRNLVSKSQIAKIALLPFVVLQKTAGLVRLPLFPAFDKVNFKEITGDYAFENGVMTVKESHMDSSAGYVTTTGTADLARDRLDLRIAAKVGGLLQGKVAGPLAFFVRGSLSDPQVKPDVAAIIKQPGVEQVLEGGKKLLKDLFK